MFSRRNPARTALLTAHWEPPEKLKALLAPHGCGYHYAQALDVYREIGEGGIEVRSTGESLAPLNLYRSVYGEPSFMKQDRRA